MSPKRGCESKIRFVGLGGILFLGGGGGGRQVGGGGGGVQGRCNREVKFLWKFKKNILWGVGGCLVGGGGGGGGVGGWGG